MDISTRERWLPPTRMMMMMLSMMMVMISSRQEEADNQLPVMSGSPSSGQHPLYFPIMIVIVMMVITTYTHRIQDVLIQTEHKTFLEHKKR